jgi:hypothetical protein
MRTEFLRKFAKIFATQYVLPVSLIRTVGKWEIFLKRANGITMGPGEHDS